MSATILYRVGDKVVYPNHGVGVIEHIRRGDAGDSSQEFYLLKIESSNLRVMVPFTNASTVGLRPVSCAAELAPVLSYLQGSETATCSSDWKWRFKENSDKMRQGGLAQVAEVVKSLVQLHQAKPLSFREKKMLDRAAMLLIAEMATASNLSPEQSHVLLKQTLAKAALALPPLEPEDVRN
ncbi:MAG: CarD family transcriptional regulator [Terriglobales bacterium]